MTGRIVWGVRRENDAIVDRVHMIHVTIVRACCEQLIRLRLSYLLF